MSPNVRRDPCESLEVPGCPGGSCPRGPPEVPRSRFPRGLGSIHPALRQGYSAFLSLSTPLPKRMLALRRELPAAFDIALSVPNRRSTTHQAAKRSTLRPSTPPTCCSNGPGHRLGLCSCSCSHAVPRRSHMPPLGITCVWLLQPLGHWRQIHSMLANSTTELHPPALNECDAAPHEQHVGMGGQGTASTAPS